MSSVLQIAQHNSLVIFKETAWPVGRGDSCEVFMRRFLLGLLVTVFSLALISCSSLNYTAKGALAGTAVGAGTGALVGSQVGSAGVGAAIGAGIGAVGGAIVGSTLQSQDDEEERLEELRRRQEQHLARQKREIQDMRRQQRYDDLYLRQTN